jgi:hypothetical protein
MQRLDKFNNRHNNHHPFFYFLDALIIYLKRSASKISIYYFFIHAVYDEKIVKSLTLVYVLTKVRLARLSRKISSGNSLYYSGEVTAFFKGIHLNF